MKEELKSKKEDEIFCKECGKPIKRNTVICPFCGVQVKELKTSIKNERQRMSKKLIVLIVILVVLFIGAVIGFCIFLGSIDWAKAVGDFLGRVWGSEY
ncbi:unnamed protein product [marine sediment metagenome]|uniref:Zinc-ribbon domain-containing protein n=1 Tax=marine sediment metagenome TaxID=412755 RepID=X1G1H9_9ZZZZ